MRPSFLHINGQKTAYCESRKDGFPVIFIHVNSLSSKTYLHQFNDPAFSKFRLLTDRNLEESLIFRFYKKNGELKWVYIHSKASDYKGDPCHFLSVGFNVTDKLVLNQNQLEIYTKEIFSENYALTKSMS